jgi:hypothetical protein
LLDPIDGHPTIHSLRFRRWLIPVIVQLVSLEFLERRNGRYYNAPSTDFFLDRRKPSYIGGILEMANHRLYPFWAHLTTALRKGTSAKRNERRQPRPFRGPLRRTGAAQGVLESHDRREPRRHLAIAHKFPWIKYRTVVDVGTAPGDLITQVALANPHIEGTGFDLPEVGPIFEEYVEANGISGRVIFSPGSFMEHALPKADVVMMGHILHDWSLETKRMLVRKAYEALTSGGAYIVYESIIDDDRSDNAFGLLMSLNMLIETADGFDYTGADCSGWMKEAGFRETRVEHLIGPDSMVIGIK